MHESKQPDALVPNAWNARTGHIEGYEVPLYLALTQPPLFWGVPREFGILTLVVTLILTVGLHLWWVGLPMGLAIHSATVALTRRDPQWLQVFRAHLKQPSFLEW